MQLCVSFEHQVLLAYVKAFEPAQDEPRRPRKLTKTHTFLKTAETRKITIMTLFENLINAVDPCCRKIHLSIHMVAHIAFQVVQRPLEPLKSMNAQHRRSKHCGGVLAGHGSCVWTLGSQLVLAAEEVRSASSSDAGRSF